MLKPLKELKVSIKEKMEKNLNKKMSDNEFEARYQEEYEHILNGYGQNSDIPARYRTINVSDIPKEVLECLPLDEKKNGLYLWGGIGTGKTHILYALKKLYAERLSNFSVKNMSELLADMKASFNGRNPIDILDELYRAYDDIGAEKETEWAGEQVYRLVNCLYENKRTVIFTSNLPLGGLAQRFGIQGDRIASRIAEMCHIVELKGKDRRI